MEELFNRSILDQLYDSISDDFETMLLKKKNLDGKFTESLKVEEELIYLIKKVVKDEEKLNQIIDKLNKLFGVIIFINLKSRFSLLNIK